MVIDPSDRDWPEDVGKNNGDYMCTCHDCGQMFNGHKRRMWCRVCRPPVAMTPQSPEAGRAEIARVARECAEHFWSDTGVMTASAQRFMRERIEAAFDAELSRLTAQVEGMAAALDIGRHLANATINGQPKSYRTTISWDFHNALDALAPRPGVAITDGVAHPAGTILYTDADDNTHVVRPGVGQKEGRRE